MTLMLHWDTLNKATREEILSGACINTRFANYEWDEIEGWMQTLIRDNLKRRSKNTVSVEN